MQQVPSMSVIIGGGGGGGGGDRGFSAAGNGGPLAGGGGGGVNWRNDGAQVGSAISLGGARHGIVWNIFIFPPGQGGGAGNVGESGITAGKRLFPVRECRLSPLCRLAKTEAMSFMKIVAGMEQRLCRRRGRGSSITSGYGGGVAAVRLGCRRGGGGWSRHNCSRQLLELGWRGRGAAADAMPRR